MAELFSSLYSCSSELSRYFRLLTRRDEERGGGKCARASDRRRVAVNRLPVVLLSAEPCGPAGCIHAVPDSAEILRIQQRRSGADGSPFSVGLRAVFAGCGDHWRPLFQDHDHPGQPDAMEFADCGVWAIAERAVSA